MRTESFNRAVQAFIKALTAGNGIEATWEALAESEGLNPADLQRAIERAHDLTADEWDED